MHVKEFQNSVQILYIYLDLSILFFNFFLYTLYVIVPTIVLTTHAYLSTYVYCLLKIVRWLNVFNNIINANANLLLKLTQNRTVSCGLLFLYFANSIIFGYIDIKPAFLAILSQLFV